jgi:hypothetical protein
MSLIQIMDLHHSDNNSLNTLTNSESTMIVGGNTSPTPRVIAKITPYNTSYSLSIANLNKVNILTVGSGASFDASFTIDGPNSTQLASGLVGYNAQLNRRYAKINYSK